MHTVTLGGIVVAKVNYEIAKISSYTVCLSTCVLHTLAIEHISLAWCYI